MRAIKFNTEEREVLKEIIALGNSQYENGFPKIAKIIFNKFRIGILHFDKKETQVLKSYTSNWINNHDALIDELREKYLKSKNINNYQHISEQEKKSMNKISVVFSIKSKLFSEKYITFKSVIEKI